jgi:hypothetical protein
LYLNAHFRIYTRSLRTYTKPWLQSFQYDVSMSTPCRRWGQDTLHYLQRECIVRLVVVLKSSEEMDRPSFPFTELYVPALTPRIHCSETALQLAGNTMIVFLCRVNTGIAGEQSNPIQAYDSIRTASVQLFAVINFITSGTVTFFNLAIQRGCLYRDHTASMVGLMDTELKNNWLPFQTSLITRNTSSIYHFF